MDVSDTMLGEAATNCRAAGAANVALVKGNDDLTAVAGRFDLVHTFIVLQHVPVERGERLFRRLVALITPGGYGAIHLTYARAVPPPPPPLPGSRLERFARTLLRPLPRGLRGRPVVALAAPEMQMNLYPFNGLIHHVQAAGAERFYLAFTDHGGWYGAQLFFRKGSGTT